MEDRKPNTVSLSEIHNMNDAPYELEDREYRILFSFHIRVTKYQTPVTPEGLLSGC